MNDLAKKSDLPITTEYAILNALPHPVLVCDESMKIQFVNDAAEIFQDMSRHMLLDKALEDIIPFGSPILELFEQVKMRLSPATAYGIKVENPLSPSSEKSIDAYVAPLAEATGQFVLMLHPRDGMEHIGRQMKFRKSGQSVIGLAEVLVHETRNPLSGIRGAAQLLERTVSDDDRPLAQLIREEADRISSLINRIDSFGDERPSKVEAVNIHTVLNHVKAIAQTGFGRHVAFIEDYDPSLPPVSGDRDQLIQVFMNLFTNAVEAMDQTASPKIWLTTSYKTGVAMRSFSGTSSVMLPIRVTIKDNGSGIDPAVMSTLFDPFVSTKSSGQGLGLALVAKLIAQHDGFIDCHSNQGNTEFQVLLPLYKGELE